MHDSIFGRRAVNILLICCVLLGTLASIPGIAVAGTVPEFASISSVHFSGDGTAGGAETASYDDPICSVDPYYPGCYPILTPMPTPTSTPSDTTKPTASITSPTSASPVYVTSSDSFDVSYSATDAGGVSTTSLTLTGKTPISSLGSGTEQTYTVSGESLSPGTYDLTLTVVDLTGNTRTVTESDAVVVDDTSPSLSDVTVSNQAGGDTVGVGGTVVISATATDALSGLDAVTADVTALGGPSKLSLDHTEGDSFEATYTLEDETLTDGIVWIPVVATDRAGKSLTNPSAITVDTTAPTITKLEVVGSDGSEFVTEGDTVVVSVQAVDPTSDVDSVTVDASPLGGSEAVALQKQHLLHINVIPSHDTEGWYGTFVVTKPSAADGPVLLTVMATDTAGNTETLSDTVTLDTTAPTFSGPSPTTRVSSRTSTISATVADANDVDWKTLAVTVERADETKLYVHDATSSSAGVSVDTTTGELTFSPKEAGLQLDEQKIRVTLSVEDTTGNVGTTTWTFDVDVPTKSKKHKQPTPVPTLLTHVDDGLASVTAVDSETETSVRITQATAGSTVNVTFDPVNVTTRTVRDGATLSEMSVTFAERADFDFRVEYSPTTFDAETPDPDGQSSVGYLRVDHEMSDASVESVTFTFDVNRSTIEAKNATPESLVLYRLVDGEWVTYDLNLVEETDDTYTFRATVPGLSLFVIGAVEAETDAPIVDAEATTPVETVTASADDLSDDAPTDVVTTPETATTSPGFGLVLALVALALCALFAGRRRD
ncbi:PGF-pre-PGF domain-containing protein [Halogranum rubrum]|uniref:PGF-pre-PGF domain-containing protein n=1 Tax=Halogranum rubrum TaxID=553466 RepID=A0A1I4JHW1_9EURY|nr:PGF-pre-PGF domain-containing protein [Halogranum rubrum]SFL65787.1 PGF-pre-PGF domain-containing protein [Halogranum rubrum]